MTKNIINEELIKFDAKLALCLQKILNSNADKKEEIAAAYKAQALQLKAVIVEVHKGSFGWILSASELLDCAVITFDNLLTNKSNELIENKMLQFVQDLKPGSIVFEAGAVIAGFIAVCALVAAIVFLIPSGGNSLLFLLAAAAGGGGAYLMHKEATKLKNASEVINSFGKFFPSKIEEQEGPSNQTDANTHLLSNKKT